MAGSLGCVGSSVRLATVGRSSATARRRPHRAPWPVRTQAGNVEPPMRFGPTPIQAITRECIQMKHPGKLLLASAAVAMLAACSSNVDAPASTTTRTSSDRPGAPPILIRNAERSMVAHQALIEGRLHADPAGCLRIGDDSGPLIIWHHDSRLERGADGRVQVIDGFTGHAASIGENIALGGAGGPNAPARVIPEMPAACATGEYWMAGQLMNAAEYQALRQRRADQAPPGAQ
ncbi:hypothetical protein ABE488_09615 [Luteimonas sp. TWI662]|uniref:hypothetical protein n=1 Tax=Luteimonas sp. TWI662 TaxID=3136789 RepID=UPI003207EB1D